VLVWSLAHIPPIAIESSDDEDRLPMIYLLVNFILFSIRRKLTYLSHSIGIMLSG
jgi:hypothetical protein